MKKPLTIPDEPQPRNVTRADLVMTEGFGLQVDGRMKTVFPTLEAAQKRARNLKAEFPMLQVKVYDAAELSKLPKTDFANDYAYNKFEPGPFGIRAKMGAAATVTLPGPASGTIAGAKYIQLTDVDGRTFSATLVSNP